jgi:cholestenol delta-isomerase
MDTLRQKLPVSPKHPYFPTESPIVGYLANEYNTFELVSLFAAGCTVIFTLTYLTVKKVRPSLPVSDLSAIMWFTLCGFIHFFFEGYYAYNFRTIGGNQDLFGQLWKEYALSDSRYLTADSAFVLCMESITAVKATPPILHRRLLTLQAAWGPLSFVTAALIAVDHPLRHPFQIIVSLGQFYGDVLYYATSLFDEGMLGLTYSRPEAAYYWGYFVLMNAFWIVIPFVLICNSVSASSRAFTALHRAEKLLNGGLQNGSAKKAQ